MLHQNNCPMLTFIPFNTQPHITVNMDKFILFYKVLTYSRKYSDQIVLDFLSFVNLKKFKPKKS